MNLKFWTWRNETIRQQAEEIKRLEQITETLVEWLSSPKLWAIKLTREKGKLVLNPVPHDLQLLQNRVALLAADDPLWPRLLALLQTNVKTETESLARAGIDDGEAHRGRGRIGMLMDIEAQLNGLWRDTHATPAAE